MRGLILWSYSLTPIPQSLKSEHKTILKAHIAHKFAVHVNIQPAVKKTTSKSDYFLSNSNLIVLGAFPKPDPNSSFSKPTVWVAITFTMAK
jgi:hypothetical protein